MKETSLEYLKDVDSSTLEMIKKEFQGKSFQVSQAILGINSSQTSYDNQLKNFNSLLTLINSVYQKVTSDQEDFVKETKKHEISNDSLTISENTQNELKAGVVELVLDGLCWLEPKILDKKEGTYVAN
jgi:magnesium chelatase subunit I